MEFNDFLNLIPKIIKIPLPGEHAHFKMAPPERKDLMQSIDLLTANPRKAAVMILIYPKDGQAYLTLIQRNSYKGVHSSQIAFPGGKIESSDASDLNAALRETHEEIGIASHQISIVCPLTPVYIPPSNFYVSPFLGYCIETPHFTPDPREVASIIEYSVLEFLDDRTVSLQKMATSYSQSIDVPSFKVGNLFVWGATAMMLSELKEVMKSVQ